jgi:hypothetical protein
MNQTQRIRTEECRTCPESARLARGLLAIHGAADDVPASVLRSVAYDIAMNCIGADMAEFQIERRTRGGGMIEPEQWQPIETAPTDGTWILGWAAKDSSPYRISWGRNHRDHLCWCTTFGSFVEGYITHWQPLRAPIA